MRKSRFTEEQMVARADIGEVLVSSTVKDLVAGSGLSFADGDYKTWREFRVWRLFAVEH